MSKSGNQKRNEIAVVVPTGFEPGAPAAMGAHESPVVGVGPVALPTYLDRRSIVMREADSEVRLSSAHRWAEPLKDGVARVVAENLAVMIPTDAALVYPWRSPRVVTYRVTLEIFRFDGTLGGPVVLNVRWRLVDKDGNELALRTVTLDEQRPMRHTRPSWPRTAACLPR